MQSNLFLEAAELIKTQHEQLAERIMQRSGIYLNMRYNQYQKDKCYQDTLYNLQYLAETLIMESPTVWENYIHWLAKLLGSLGLNLHELADYFRVMGEVMGEELEGQTASFVAKLAQSAVSIVLSGGSGIISAHDSSGKYLAEAKRYQELLLTAQKRKALDYIDHLVERGVPFRNIYLDILQPVQREIGNLWHTNKISVAQEHYCTGVTQLAIARIYPHMFNSKPSKFKMVGTCVQGELHELGLRMVTDIMELDGWDTMYLGANMPNDSIVSMIKEQKADLVAISVTFPLNLHKAEKLISQIRAESELNKVRILVGGYAFMQDATLWQKIGADSFAPNADLASKVATNMVESVK